MHSLSSVLQPPNPTNESTIKVLHFRREFAQVIDAISLFNLSCTLIAAPSGARHWARSCVAALEKGVTITFELRLAANRMTNSHLQRLKVAVHLPSSCTMLRTE